jgi:hypothetical protein
LLLLFPLLLLWSSKLMRSSMSEALIHLSYPESTLPPLWEVIYQEAIRGHHLLFRRDDIERYECDGNESFWQDASLTDELERIVLRIIAAADLQAMVKTIDSLRDEDRQSLYFFYRRSLWMWRHYMKSRLN